MTLGKVSILVCGVGKLHKILWDLISRRKSNVHSDQKEVFSLSLVCALFPLANTADPLITVTQLTVFPPIQMFRWIEPVLFNLCHHMTKNRPWGKKKKNNLVKIECDLIVVLRLRFLIKLNGIWKKNKWPDSNHFSVLRFLRMKSTDVYSCLVLYYQIVLRTGEWWDFFVCLFLWPHCCAATAAAAVNCR